MEMRIGEMEDLQPTTNSLDPPQSPNLPGYFCFFSRSGVTSGASA